MLGLCPGTDPVLEGDHLQYLSHPVRCSGQSPCLVAGHRVVLPGGGTAQGTD